jgi:hypothetical protein
MRKVLPFAVFAVFLGVWTWKLLEPNPVPEPVLSGIPTDWKFWLFKAVHLGGYAFLTVLAAWLPIRRPFFWAIVVFLALHGAASEFLQWYLELGRHGCVRDVVIDWVGIGIGLGVLRWWGRGGAGSES